MRQDLRFAARTLRQSPGFSALAILTLALGIGASTAIFSTVNAVLLRPLPFRDPGWLLRIWETAPADRLNADRRTVSPANFLSWARDAELFEGVAATNVGLNQTVTLTGLDSPAKLPCDRVSASLFQLLGVQPVLGRAFLPEEERPGHDRVVLLSHELWRSRFGADPQIVGRSLSLDQESYRVTGVLPAEFRSPDRWDSTEAMFLLRPLSFEAASAVDRGGHFLNVLARLRPGVTMARAQAKLDTLARAVEREDAALKGWGVRIVGLHEDMVRDSRRSLSVLSAAVGLVLLLACVSVANLLLARAATQRKEIAIRAALGAGRWRLTRQLLAHSLLLGLLGGALGVVSAFLGVLSLRALAPPGIPRFEEASIDLTVLGFGLVASLGAALVFGVAPAWQASRADLGPSLKEGSRTATGSSSSRFHRALVVAEVALALVLAVGAGLFIETLRMIQTVEPGYRMENVLALNIAPPASRYPDPRQRAAFFQQVLERVQALPGVESAGVVSDFPLGGSGGGRFVIDGRTPPVNPREWDAEFRAVSPDYFRTLGIPLLEGRSLTSLDAGESEAVAVVNQTAARRFWPGRSPIDERIRRGPADAPWITIVGVVGDVRHDGPLRQPFAEVYVSYLQPFALPLRFPFPRELAVRATMQPAALVPALRQAVWAVDKDQPISGVRTLEQLHWRSMSRQRFHMLLLSLFAGVGIVLACVGIYGVLSQSVSARVFELAVRLALGAQRRQILAAVVGEGMLLAVLGVALGIAAALGISRALSTLLFGVSATDPGTFVAVSALLLGVAALSCFVPAWRASSLDPLAALRR